MQIQKRDGRIVEFNPAKIKKAILKAFAAIDGEVTDYAISKADSISDYIEGYCMDAKNVLSIEDVQDLVENGLMNTRRKDVARAYIIYRDKRSRNREKNSPYVKNIQNKIDKGENSRQNANVDEESFGGQIGEASGANLKLYALNYKMPKWMAEKHLNNEIYIHDLDAYASGMHNCLSIPFDDLLATGFNTRQTDVRPANSVNTAFQLVAVIFQLQSLNQFGGVSATHLDWTMVPYVRKSFRKHMIDGLHYLEGIDDEDYINSIPKELRFDDPEANDPAHAKAYQYALDMTRKETYQAVEGMYHNLK